MNSKQRRAMVHNMSKALTGPYLPERPRLEQQQARAGGGGLVGWRFYAKGRTVYQDPGLGTMRVGSNLAWSQKRCSGMSKPGVVRGKVALAWDKNVKAQ